MRRVFVEVYNQRNPAVWDELCVPDVVFHNASFTLQGLQAIKQFVLLFLAYPPYLSLVSVSILSGTRQQEGVADFDTVFQKG